MHGVSVLMLVFTKMLRLIIECHTRLLPVQIGETSNAELDSIIQQVKEIKYKGIKLVLMLSRGITYSAEGNLVRPA